MSGSIHHMLLHLSSKFYKENSPCNCSYDLAPAPVYDFHLNPDFNWTSEFWGIGKPVEPAGKSFKDGFH